MPLRGSVTIRFQSVLALSEFKAVMADIKPSFDETPNTLHLR